MLKKTREWLAKPVDAKYISPKEIKEQKPKIKGTPVQITDIDMPFMSMVWFMVKWAFATIPAIIIIWVVIGFISGIIGGLLGFL